MTKKIFVMVGIPASGKSTYAEHLMVSYEMNGFTVGWISRDEVRKEMIGDGAYFSREREVYKEFVRRINEAINLGMDYIIIDATHIDAASRNKLVKRISPSKETVVEFIIVDCPVEVALARNAKREGFANVPDRAIRGFAERMTYPMGEEIDRWNAKFAEVRYKVIKGGD